jgi:hypothetical protein
MLNVKEPSAEMARSFPPLFRSTRPAPLASPETAPPTVPVDGVLVVLPPLHANRKRDEHTSAVRVEIRVFTGDLSIRPDGGPASE